MPSFFSSPRITKLVLSSFAVLMVAAGAPAAFGQKDMSGVEIKSQQLAPGIAVLFGSGGNIAVSYGEDGTVLIDDQFAPLTVKIQKAVADLGATPVKFLINTHWHGDHSGGNENFGKEGAIIIAHNNVRVRMAAGGEAAGRQFAPAPKAALPAITYEGGLNLHLNSEEVRIIHVDASHTDGDSIIYWTKSNIVHMGDTFFHKVSFPFVDLNSGGDVRGFVKAADIVLELANDETKIIPGHGPVGTKADLRAYREMIAEIIGKVEDAKRAGATLEALQAMKIADKYPLPKTGFISPNAFIEATYKSMASKP